MLVARMVLALSMLQSVLGSSFAGGSAALPCAVWGYNPYPHCVTYQEEPEKEPAAPAPAPVPAPEEPAITEECQQLLAALEQAKSAYEAAKAAYDQAEAENEIAGGEVRHAQVELAVAWANYQGALDQLAAVQAQLDRFGGSPRLEAKVALLEAEVYWLKQAHIKALAILEQARIKEALAEAKSDQAIEEYRAAEDLYDQAIWAATEAGCLGG